MAGVDSSVFESFWNKIQKAGMLDPHRLAVTSMERLQVLGQLAWGPDAIEEDKKKLLKWLIAEREAALFFHEIHEPIKTREWR